MYKRQFKYEVKPLKVLKCLVTRYISEVIFIVQVLQKFLKKNAPGVSKDDLILRARELENVEKFLRKEKITRIIHVPDKLLNFVIS